MILSVFNISVLGLFYVWLFLLSTTALACPFCEEAEEKPLHREIEGKSIAALVRPVGEVPGYEEMLRARTFGSKELTFEVDRVLRGSIELDSADRFTVKALGFFRKDTSYLMTSVHPGPMRPRFRAVGDRAVDFLEKYADLPNGMEGGPGGKTARLAFFRPYLDSPDKGVAGAARSEFAQASYAEVRQLRPFLDAGEVIRYIDAPASPSPSYGLQFLFLGLCGTTEHLALLEQWLQSPERFGNEGVEALMSSYLMISGAAGLPRLMEVIRQAEDAQARQMSFSLVRALRFHSTNETVLQESDLVDAYRSLLKNPYVAHLAIRALRQLSDWDALPLVWAAYHELMENEPQQKQRAVLTRFLRNYLEKCPKPAAKEYLASLPGHVQRMP